MARSVVCLFLLAVFGCALVHGLDYYVREGDGCHLLEEGQPTTSACDISDLNWAFKSCAALSECEASPTSFILFSVEHGNGLGLLTHPFTAATVSMNATHATAVGTLQSLAFRNVASGDKLTFVNLYDDGSYLTSAGPCQLGATCTLGGFTVTATQYTSEALLTERESLVATTVMTVGAVAEPVYLQLYESYGVSATAEVHVFLTEQGVLVSETYLADVAVSGIPRTEISHMALKNTDQATPYLTSEVTRGDFQRYVQTDCSQVAAPEVSGVTCELYEFFPTFSFSPPWDFGDSPEEVPSFILFE